MHRNVCLKLELFYKLFLCYVFLSLTLFFSPFLRFSMFVACDFFSPSIFPEHFAKKANDLQSFHCFKPYFILKQKHVSKINYSIINNCLLANACQWNSFVHIYIYVYCALLSDSENIRVLKSLLSTILINRTHI